EGGGTDGHPGRRSVQPDRLPEDQEERQARGRAPVAADALRADDRPGPARGRRATEGDRDERRQDEGEAVIRVARGLTVALAFLAATGPGASGQDETVIARAEPPALVDFET